MADSRSAGSSVHPLALDVEEARRMGREAGRDYARQAGACPYSPPDAERHRAWMDGFSQGRIDAGSQRPS